MFVTFLFEVENCFCSSLLHLCRQCFNGITKKAGLTEHFVIIVSNWNLKYGNICATTLLLQSSFPALVQLKSTVDPHSGIDVNAWRSLVSQISKHVPWHSEGFKVQIHSSMSNMFCVYLMLSQIYQFH